MKTDLTPREVETLAALQELVAAMKKQSDLDTIARALADEADALLVDGLGLSTASNWWRRYTLETTGRAVLADEDENNI